MLIETLKVFCDLVETASFSGAAERNRLTQSAVSQKVRALESGYGVVMVERGAGRHKLGAACARHGVALDNAHSAEADARAAGELFYKLVPKLGLNPATLGAVLGWQRKAEANSWFDFHSWLSRQPPREGARP